MFCMLYKLVFSPDLCLFKVNVCTLFSLLNIYNEPFLLFF